MPKKQGSRTSRVGTSVAELRATVQGEIRRVGAFTSERSGALESIAAQVESMNDELISTSSATDLSRMSHQFRVAAAYAVVMAAELYGVAGRLETLAALRRADEAAGSPGS